MTYINAATLQEVNFSTIEQPPLFQLKAYHQEKRLITWQQMDDEKIYQNQGKKQSVESIESIESFLWITSNSGEKIQEVFINATCRENDCIDVESCYNALLPYISEVKIKNKKSDFLLIGLPQILLTSLQIPLLRKLYAQEIAADILETGAACRMIRVLQEERRDFHAVLIP